MRKEEREGGGREEAGGEDGMQGVIEEM